MTTISVFRAVAGGYVGDGHVHPAVLDAAREAVADAREDGRILDAFVARCGPNVGLVLSHTLGAGSTQARGVADEAFARAASVAVRLGQHGAPAEGACAVDGAELDFHERASEPLVCLFSSGACGGVWDIVLRRAFGGAGGPPPGAAAASEGSDPVLLVRCHDDFPAVRAVVDALAAPVVVGGPGGMTTLMPVSTTDDVLSRSHGPARTIGLGFQLASGRLVGPRDLLADRALDAARAEALSVAEFLRRARDVS